MKLNGHQVSSLDLAMCVMTPLVLFFLGFLTQISLRQEERLADLEKSNSSIETHLEHVDTRLETLSRDVRELLRGACAAGTER